jgi:hypothetical protein
MSGCWLWATTPVEFVRRLLVVAFSQVRGSGFEVAEEATGAFAVK